MQDLCRRDLKTAAGGEIDCLDPGGFGAVTITKSITLDCTGTLGSILSASTNGINVNDASTGTPNTIRVVLRGLTINGAGTGLVGVTFSSGASLVIDDCIIQNHRAGAALGVSFRPAGAAQLVVLNSVITNNGSGASGGGILVQPTGASGSARVSLNNARVDNNGGDGISLLSTGTIGAAGLFASIERSDISANARGVIVTTAASATSAALALLANSSVTNNSGIGVQADGGAARIRVGTTTITNNGFGVGSTNGGIVFTFGNNLLGSNATDGSFQSPALPPQ